VNTRAPGLLTINGGSSGIRFAVFTAGGPHVRLRRRRPVTGLAPGAE